MLFHNHEIEYLSTEDSVPAMFHHTDVENGEIYEYIYPEVKDSSVFVVSDNSDPALYDPHFAVRTYRKARYCYTFS